VVLGVTGGIAAYKSVQLARDLTRLGCEVDVVMTGAAQEFVRPLSFQAVTGRTVLTDLFSAEGAALHIRLGQEADVVCVAPATADLMARAAHGRADDLLTTTLLATAAPVVLCPAMNERMFLHSQTQANLRHLETVLGYGIAGPASGPLAHGESEGAGRMLEPHEIVQYVGRELGREARFDGKRVLVTSGPTREPLDPVRFLGNRSSGRMGSALAAAAWRRGCQVSVVTGPSTLPCPTGVHVGRVETAREMLDAVASEIPKADIVVMAAAVADYRPEPPRPDKIKRSQEGDELHVRLTANPDIAAETRSLRRPDAVIVGFALETESLIERAAAKLESKGFDLLVANSAVEPDSGFEVETNRVVLLGREGGREDLPLLSKDEVAEIVLDRVGGLLQSRDAAATPAGEPA
jgi:phosphopantothenoylcysteine decarboxylase/phosphopantothenate--cysteine ligase